MKVVSAVSQPPSFIEGTQKRFVNKRTTHKHVAHVNDCNRMDGGDLLHARNEIRDDGRDEGKLG